MEFAPKSPEKEKEPALDETERNRITSLRYPLEGLYRKYQTEIERGDYGLILGDDVSGRIPTLILSEVIKDVYRERGYVAPLVRFVAGGYHTSMRDEEESHEALERRLHGTEQLLRGYAKEMQGHGCGSRILLVTEAISWGEAMNKLLDGITRVDIPVDVAAVSAKEEGVRAVEKTHGVRVQSARNVVPDIYAARQLTGVQKDRGSPVARALHRIHPYDNVSAPVREARELVKEVAERIKRDLKENS